MEEDDPTTPLLGAVPRNRFRNAASKLCSVQSWKRRLPITIWLPKYNSECLLRDAIAGITVGLTSIPQGIAYAIIAGLPPQVGLYSSIFPGVVYALFGSCKDVTVGPTAILAALLAKYVAKSADFAYLASFLSGCVILLLGILQLGFLLDFISKPVISAFTTAAALQISASQLKSLFRTKGSSGGTFVNAIINFFRNISTVQLWDTVLGAVTIVALLILKRATISATDTNTRARICLSQTWTYVIRARNALVVFAAAFVAYCLHLKGLTPFSLTGKIEGGLPHFGPPPFSTIVGNQTLSFGGMLSVYGVEGLVMPLVAILESIAIAKAFGYMLSVYGAEGLVMPLVAILERIAIATAFAGSKAVDGTQEMLAIGACNLLSSFAQSMPATGSFTRTAINHASGVLTPAGSLFKASLVLLSVTLLSEAFYFIPRSTLAAVIIMAMYSIVDFTIVRTLWRNSKGELAVWSVTLVAGCVGGLEYGILCGVGGDVVRALAAGARPPPHAALYKVGNIDCVTLTFVGPLNFASATHVQTCLLGVRARVIVIDGKYLGKLDLGVAENLVTIIQDLEASGHKCLLWNFKDKHQKLFEDLKSEISSRFISGPSVDQHILGMEPSRL